MWLLNTERCKGWKGSIVTKGWWARIQYKLEKNGFTRFFSVSHFRKRVKNQVSENQESECEHTCCKCRTFISGWGRAGSAGCRVVAEEAAALLEAEEVSSAGPSFSLMTASPLMMWYKMANKDSAMCGPYSMGNFCPHSCCTAKKAFCKDNMYLTVNLWIVYVSLSKRPFAKRCKLNRACRLYN